MTKERATTTRRQMDVSFARGVWFPSRSSHLDFAMNGEIRWKIRSNTLDSSKDGKETSPAQSDQFHRTNFHSRKTREPVKINEVHPVCFLYTVTSVADSSGSSNVVSNCRSIVCTNTNSCFGNTAATLCRSHRQASACGCSGRRKSSHSINVLRSCNNKSMFSFDLLIPFRTSFE